MKDYEREQLNATLIVIGIFILIIIIDNILR